MNKKIVNDIKQGSLANSIVLHDFETPTPEIVKRWFYYTVQFFEDNGLIPNRMGGTGKPKKTIAFERARKQHESDEFHEVTQAGLWFGAVPSTATQEGLDSIFSTHLDIREGKRNKTLVLTFDNQIVFFSEPTIDKLVSDLSQFFKPKYGYAYQRDFKKGPTWYPFGVCVGLDWDKDKEERSELTKWNDKYHMPEGRYKTGDLRDIYPLNLLSAAHQEHIVDGKPFFEWITADPKRGTLTQINDSLWAWWVEPDHIPYVREVLRPLGWVIAI